MIKSTYSLDPDTVRKLERLAARWQVSKSEVLRRAVAAADKAPEVKEKPADLTPLEALRKLQDHLKLTPAKARAWETEVKRNRRAAFQRNREWLRP